MFINIFNQSAVCLCKEGIAKDIWKVNWQKKYVTKWHLHRWILFIRYLSLAGVLK